MFLDFVLYSCDFPSFSSIDVRCSSLSVQCFLLFPVLNSPWRKSITNVRFLSLDVALFSSVLCQDIGFITLKKVETMNFLIEDHISYFSESALCREDHFV